MNFLVALLGEVLGTEVTFVGFDVLVDQEVILEAAFAGESLATTFELAEQELTRALGRRIEKLDLIVTFRFLQNFEVFAR